MGQDGIALGRGLGRIGARLDSSDARESRDRFCAVITLSGRRKNAKKTTQCARVKLSPGQLQSNSTRNIPAQNPSPPFIHYNIFISQTPIAPCGQLCCLSY